MILNNEIKEKNYLIFLKKLTELGIDTTMLETVLDKDKIKSATFNITNGGDGTLLNTILRVLTPNALKLLEMSEIEGLAINKESLIKVCLLSHISKVEMFQVGKREGTFEYAPYPYGMKMGLRSIALCEQMNIKLTAEEIEAMTILDRENEEQAKFFASPLASIIKIANELTFLHIKFLK
jgi:hypothetical protein